MPTSGKWIYLHTIERYITVPDGISMASAIGQCEEKLPTDTDYYCPDWPTISFQKPGTGVVEIDQSGKVAGSEADKAHFSFLFPPASSGGS